MGLLAKLDLKRIDLSATKAEQQSNDLFFSYKGLLSTHQVHVCRRLSTWSAVVDIRVDDMYALYNVEPDEADVQAWHDIERLLFKKRLVHSSQQENHILASLFGEGEDKE